jgi:hypothetical protein
MLKRSLALCLSVAPSLFAQDSLPVKPTPPRVTVGVTTGTMGFRDQRVQQGITGVIRYHLYSTVSVAMSPTFARVAFPTTLGGGSVSGLTDLPLELAADHSFDVPWSPTTGLSLGLSLPVGDKQVGFGTGAVGANVGVGLGLSPLEALSFHIGFGKPLNDYSLTSALGASSSAWGDLETSYQLLEGLEATAGFDGDVAGEDSIGPSRAVALSLAIHISGPYEVTLSGGHGISGAAARWTLAIGVGTDFTGIQALGSSSPIQRFMRALGGGSNRGKGSSSSGRGRGP